MAESFENLDSILCDWTKDKGQKSLVEALNRYNKKEEERKSRFFLRENDGEKILKQSQSAVRRARLNQTQNGF